MAKSDTPTTSELVKAIATANRHPDPEGFTQMVTDILNGVAPPAEVEEEPLEVTEEAPAADTAPSSEEPANA